MLSLGLCANQRSLLFTHCFVVARCRHTHERAPARLFTQHQIDLWLFPRTISVLALFTAVSLCCQAPGAESGPGSLHALSDGPSVLVSGCALLPLLICLCLFSATSRVKPVDRSVVCSSAASAGQSRRLTQQLSAKVLVLHLVSCRLLPPS